MQPAEWNKNTNSSVAIAINMNLKYVHMFFFLLNGEMIRIWNAFATEKIPCRRRRRCSEMLFYFPLFFRFSSLRKSIRFRSRTHGHYVQTQHTEIELLSYCCAMYQIELNDWNNESNFRLSFSSNNNNRFYF